MLYAYSAILGGDDEENDVLVDMRLFVPTGSISQEMLNSAEVLQGQKSPLAKGKYITCSVLL